MHSGLPATSSVRVLCETFKIVKIHANNTKSAVLTTPALKQKTEVDYLVFLVGLKAAVEFILHSSLWKVKNPLNPRVFWQKIPLVFDLDVIF